MNRCIDCKRWNMRDAGKMAALSFGQCDLKMKGHYTSRFAYKCDKFVEADADAVEKRVAWLDKQKG